MIPLRDTIRSRHFPVMNWLLLGANAAVFIFQLSLSEFGEARLVSAFGLVPARLTSGNAFGIVGLFSSMFMHGGWLHFLSNMWILYIFGDNVEDRMGSIPYLVFYILSGLAAGLLQTFITPGSPIPVIGASGAIAGVMGAYILLYPAAKVVTLIPVFIFPWFIQVPAFFFLGFWFVSQLFSGVAAIGTVGGGVAWWAHIGGFLFGLLLVRFFDFRPPPPPEPEPYYVYTLPREDYYSDF
ncbi:MAG: rhomboid family intramembrane serine protease [Chloroflexi bacterium]|nr:MAG: rhomboid family intramembrane serine protease [Chloroflexota bacterium]MBL1197405.1 rhomboid family intramembrane serine protease [Chloroflexota bacterium]NOH14701.1 rhomboid family intramembrane serine protease [Chloroflexota bacterium]